MKRKYSILKNSIVLCFDTDIKVIGVKAYLKGNTNLLYDFKLKDINLPCINNNIEDTLKYFREDTPIVNRVSDMFKYNLTTKDYIICIPIKGSAPFIKYIDKDLNPLYVASATELSSPLLEGFRNTIYYKDYMKYIRNILVRFKDEEPIAFEMNLTPIDSEDEKWKEFFTKYCDKDEITINL